MRLNINTPIGFTGYGVAGLNLCKELSKDSKISLFPIGNINVESQEDYDLVSDLIDNQQSCEYEAKNIKIWHQFDLLNHIGRGEYTAFPFFELDTLKPNEIHHLNFPDKIIVASQWAKDVLINNGIKKPIYIVPLGVDRSIFHENQPEIPELKTNAYKFLMAGKWEVRKGYDILVNLFNSAFTEQDDVELWILGSSHESCFQKKELDEWHGHYMNSRLKNKIKILPRVPSQKDVARIMGNADCGIFISRAEGWNLELLEMMSTGKSVITTNYSAHTEFATKDNSMLVDIDSTEKAYDGKWFHGDGNWAKLGKVQQDSIIDYMKQCYSNRNQQNIEGTETAKAFSWKNSAEKLIEALND